MGVCEPLFRLRSVLTRGHGGGEGHGTAQRDSVRAEVCAAARYCMNSIFSHPKQHAFTVQTAPLRRTVRQLPVYEGNTNYNKTY